MKRVPVNRCLIICNGEIPVKLLKKFFGLNNKEKELFTIAADGAAGTLRKYGFCPDVITGDLDSIDSSTLQFFQKKNVRIQSIKDQSRNDLEKALGFALVGQYPTIDVIGATGKRIDHTLNNLSVLKKYSVNANIRFFDNEFVMNFVDGRERFDYKKNDVVSLIPLPDAENIYAKGLKYKLSNSSLEFGKMTGALNTALSDKITIDANGSLLVIRKHFGNID